jgi:carboxymethylenebutenolidase
MQEISIATAGANALVGWLAPAAEKGPGILLLQEIFGVNDHIRFLARRFAERGFPTFAPDLYWRLKPKVSLGYSQTEAATAFDLYRRFDVESGVEDIGKALAVLREHPACDGRVVIIGYCLGGLLALLAAARNKPNGVVAYYGVGIERHLSDLRLVSCPALLHFGDNDTHVPAAAITQIRDVAEAISTLTVAVHAGAGHAFANEQRPNFYHQNAAQTADEMTFRFLRDVLGGGGLAPLGSDNLSQK